MDKTVGRAFKPPHALVIALLLLFPALLVAQTLDDFDRIVDFGIALKELHVAASAGTITTTPDSFFIIDGAVASRRVVQSDRESFLGELELVNGEWVGVEEVLLYRCIVQLVGPEFFEAIPARRSRRANPAEIALNTRLLIVGKLTELRILENGQAIPVLQAYYIRTLN